MWFKQRKQLEDKYYEWIKKNGVKDCPFSVISYLDAIGLLKEPEMKNEGKTILPKMFNKPSSTDTKQVVLDQLAEENEQVIGLAYMYAKNMQTFGVDVTKPWDSAVQQSAALNEAYTRGRCDSDRKWRKRCGLLGKKASQVFIDEFFGA